jgi:hypothetical protein
MVEKTFAFGGGMEVLTKRKEVVDAMRLERRV